jgi:hypothetical protein
MEEREVYYFDAFCQVCGEYDWSVWGKQLKCLPIFTTLVADEPMVT